VTSGFASWKPYVAVAGGEVWPPQVTAVSVSVLVFKLGTVKESSSTAVAVALPPRVTAGAVEYPEPWFAMVNPLTEPVVLRTAVRPVGATVQPPV
jgi:hypothetical protein